MIRVWLTGWRRSCGVNLQWRIWAKHNKILGMRIIHDIKTKRFSLVQQRYIEKVLNRFNIKDAKPMGTLLSTHFKLSEDLFPYNDKEKDERIKIPYASTIGSLMYAMVCTCPNIAHSVGVVSRFLSNPRKQHWQAIKWILRYLKGTSNYCLRFGNSNIVLEGFTNEDMVGDVYTRNSTTSYLYTFVGAIVSWVYGLQKVVSLSTKEA